MKKILLLLIVFSFKMVSAQTWDTIKKGNVTVYQQNIISPLISSYQQNTQSNKSVEGFRVQIIMSTNRKTVLDTKSAFIEKFPDIKTYFTYQQPYFKLRAGDFENRIDAEQLLNQVIQYFPSSFIVPDNIKTSEN